MAREDRTGSSSSTLHEEETARPDLSEPAAKGLLCSGPVGPFLLDFVDRQGGTAASVP